MKHFRHKLLSVHMRRFSLCSLFLCAVVVPLALVSLGRDEGTNAGGNAMPKGALSGMIIAVDAGHGGYDGGARAHDSGIWEKGINLAVALQVEKALMNEGAQVIMTRREDVSLHTTQTGSGRKREDLRNRMELAKQQGAQAILSIHMNEYRSRRESGPQVFYQRGGEDGRLLAGAIQQALIEGLDPPKKRDAMAGNYYILRSELPSALIECGFISNPQEEKLLLDSAYQEKLAQAIAQGMIQWAKLREQSDP